MIVWVLGGMVAGLIAGSFFATLIVRWPHDKTLSGRSRCDGCGVQLTVRDLIPFVSFVLARGRCRACGGAIDPLHVRVEFACAAVGGGAFLLAPGLEGVLAALTGWLLVTLAWLDARHFWLPDRLVIALALLGVGGGLWGVGPALQDRAIGGLTGFASLALIAFGYRMLRGRVGLGGGDPKLFGAIGLWLGWTALPFVLLGASGVGLGIVALGAANGRGVTWTTRVPLGTFLALAAIGFWAATKALPLA